jgi:pantetheine-phosphate adenylyltransferase
LSTPMSQTQPESSDANSLSRTFRRAVYPGSFGPITLGHHDIIIQAARAFDELTIAVGVNHEKQPIFTDQERVEMIEHDIKTHIMPELEKAGVKCDLKVARFNGATARFMKEVGADFYVRGLRLGTEFDQEMPSIAVSRQINPAFTPVFFCGSEEKLQTVSSTVARELCKLGEDDLLDQYVTPHVAQTLTQRMDELGMRPGVK